MSREKRKIFSGIDITLITVVALLGLGIVIFSGTLIWLIATL